MRYERHCRTPGCATRIGLESNWCDACVARINERFEEDKARLAQAGSLAFVPQNAYERRAHRAALRTKRYGNGRH